VNEKRNSNRTADSSTNLEQAVCNATLPEDATSRVSAPCSVRFHSVRNRLADIDGLSGKAILDGIVLAGILADDSSKFVKEVSHSQSKGNKAENEKTVVTITWEDDK